MDGRRDEVLPLSLARRRSLGLVLPAAGIAGLLLLLAIGRPPDDSFAWRTVYDMGHVVLFGVVALLVLRLLWQLGEERRPLGWGHYLVALMATAAVSLVSELLQVGQPGRDASVGDALNNLTGAIGFLAIAAALRPALWGALGAEGRTASRFVLAVAVLVLVVALSPLAAVAWHYAMRRAAVPVVAEFGAAWQAPFTSAPRAEVSRAPPPPGWTGRRRPAARVQFLDSPWPGVSIREPWPDWRGYSVLRLQVYSELEEPVELAMRIDDGHRVREYKDRFNGSFIVVPGLNDFIIPLSTIRNAPRNRTMDLGRVAQIILFTRRPDQPFDVYLGEMWLETAEGEEKASP